MTYRPTLSPESDSAVGPIPIPTPINATPSADAQEEEHTADGLYPTKTTTTSKTAAAATAATAKIPFSDPLRFAAAVPSLFSSQDVMRGEGGVLREVEEGTISMIRYLAPQLELELYPGLVTRGGSKERLGGWDGGRINDDGGGDGNINAMARHQNRVAYKEDNKLRPGDGGGASQ